MPLVEVHVACTAAKAFSQEEINQGNDANLLELLYAEAPRPGSSIGPRGGTTSSSLEPYVRVETGDGLYDAAIVAHHVAFGHAEPYKLTRDGPVVIECPSPADFKHFVATTQDVDVSGCAGRIPGQIEECPGRAGPGAPQCKIIERTIADRVSDRRAVGQVLASSGLVSPGPDALALDWALLKLGPGRVQQQEGVSKMMSFALLDHGGLRCKFNLFRRTDIAISIMEGTCVPPTDTCVRVRDLLAQEDNRPPLAFLYGRTSGL